MKIFKFSLTVIILLFFSSLAIVKAQIPNGLLFTVNHHGDSVDVNPGDSLCADLNGQCTLRAALQEANAKPGNDVINFTLGASSVIDLTLGELPVTSSVAIVGPGARRLTVQRSFNAGTPNFRIFHVPGDAGVNIIIRGLTIKNGRAENSLLGGGVYVERGNIVNLNDLAVNGNWAISGGGICNAGTVNISRSLINSNTANSQGGALMNIDGLSVMRIIDSTITDNTANTSGAIDNSGSLLLVNDTITHNAAPNAASGIFSGPGGSVNVLNTIIGSNNSSTPNTLSGAFNSLGNNIITDARGSTGFTDGVNDDQVSDNNIINPLLGALADNGGQTDTRALLDGSPAIDRGNNCVRTANCPTQTQPPLRLTTDQRDGHRRQVGNSVDVGAFEAGSSAFTTSIGFGGGVFNRTGRYANAIVILTNATTGEKRYSFTNPFGSYRFNNLPGGAVYILEFRNKRTGILSPQVIAFDDFLLFPVPLNAESNPSGFIFTDEK